MKEKKRFRNSLLLPLAFVVVFWFIKTVESILGVEFYQWGVLPRELSGLKGVFLSPLLHGDWMHLFNNTVPFLVLGTAIGYFFRNVYHKVFIWIYLLSGIFLWIGGRQVYHIGASGVIYGFAAFLFFSGILSRNYRLWALSLLVVFLYGGMIWGVLPVENGISWDGHLFGLISGVFAAFRFRKYAPERKKYSWEDKEEESNDPHMHIWDHEKYFPPPEE